MTELFAHGYALLIGVGAELPVTAKDATALNDVLVDPNRAAYPPDQVRLLTWGDAQRENILSAFDSLISRVNADPQATVVIYFSGHGGRIERPDRPNEYYLLPYGYITGRWAETGISAAMFTEKVEAIKAQKLVVLLDCCHAAAIPLVKAPGETFIKTPADLLTMLSGGSGRVIIASSHEQEYSHTGEPYSIFTACLLEAMAGKALVRTDGYVRILDVLSYLFEHVSKRAPGPQHPLLKKALDLNDNFPICYYAGGKKGIPGVTSTHTSGSRGRIQQQIDGLTQAWMLCSEKVMRLRVALKIEDDPLRKFKYEHNLREAEEEMEKLDREMKDLERRLE